MNNCESCKNGVTNFYKCSIKIEIIPDPLQEIKISLCESCVKKLNIKADKLKLIVHHYYLRSELRSPETIAKIKELILDGLKKTKSDNFPADQIKTYFYIDVTDMFFNFLIV